MESWETPALTGYFCKDFLSITTLSQILLRKSETRRNIWPEIPYGLSLNRNHTQNQKGEHISPGDQQTYYLQVFQKGFTNHKMLTRP